MVIAVHTPTRKLGVVAKQRKILVVDDEESDRQAAANPLRAEGYTVVLADGYEDGIAAYDKNPGVSFLVADVSPQRQFLSNQIDFSPRRWSFNCHSRRGMDGIRSGRSHETRERSRELHQGGARSLNPGH